MGFLDLLRSIAGRAGQEWQSADKDTLPNPLAGVGGAAPVVHYNPLSNVPLVGGLINRTVNAPLHTAGLINEGAGQAAQAGAGEVALLAALAQHLGTPDSAATQSANAILAQGPLHPGRALAAARTGPDSGTAWLAGALELAMNPLNYAGPIGEAGAAMRAGGQASHVGSALETLSAILHAGNLPAQAGFSGLAGLVKGPGNVLPSIERSLGVAAPDTFHAVQAMDNQQLLNAAGAGDANAMARLKAIIESPGTFGDVPRSELIPGIGADGKPGIGPTLPPEAGPQLPPLQGPAFPERGNARGFIGPILNPEQGPQLPPLYGPALPERGNVPVDWMTPGIGTGGRPGLGPVLPPSQDVPLPPELGPTLEDVARGNVPPAQLIPGIGRNGGKGLGPLRPIGPPNPVPDEALTALDEAAAKAAPDLAPPAPVAPAAPDLPALSGTRQDLLATLAPNDLTKLVSLAYNDVPKAMQRAVAKYPDPTDLAEAALRRIQTGLGSDGRAFKGGSALPELLTQRHPDLAAWVAALPDAATNDVAAATNGVAGAIKQVAATDPYPAFLDLVRSVTGDLPLPNSRFYTDKLGVAAQDVPALFKRAAGEGVIGELPMEPGRFAVRPGASFTPKVNDVPNVDIPAVDSAATIARGNAAKADLFGDAADQLPRRGGDIAAGGGGGGGMGIVPYVLPAAASRALVGAGAGGLLGGAAGALADPDDRMGGFTKGAAIGAGAGGTLGAAANEPNLALAKEFMAENFAPKTGKLAGGSVGETFNNLTGVVRGAKKTAAMVPLRNAIGAAENVAGAGGDVGLATRYALDLYNQAKTLLPALRAAGGDQAARDAAMFAASPAEIRAYGPEAVAALDRAGGSAYERNAADADALAKLSLGQAAAAGVVGSLANPRSIVMGLPSVGLGLAEGLTLKGRAAVQRALTTFIDVGARRSLSFPVFQAELAQDAPAFIQKVAAADPALAATLDPAGRFDPAALPKGTLQDDWRAIQQHAAEVAGRRAVDAMGDFTSPSATQNLWNTIFPGGSWNIQQAAVLARQAARRPALATGLLGAAIQDYHRHLVGGDPQNALTVSIDDRTPGLGLAARALNGGAPGVAHVSPVYPFSPFSGETLDLPRQVGLLKGAGYPMPNPNQGLAGTALAVTNALGLADNPIGQELAYKFGAIDEPPGTPVRLAPLGTYLDAKANQALGLPLGANPVAALMAPASKPLDTGALQQQLNLGLYQDPAIAKAGAEIIYRETGKPASDPSNAPLLAQLRDHHSALYAQALDEGLGAKAAQAVASETLPVPARAETRTQADLGKAQQALLHGGIPFTPAQRLALLSGDLPTGSAAFVAALDREKESNPLLRVNDAATPEAQAQTVLNDWRAHNAWLTLFPALYQQQLAFEQERLGLVPAGSAAQQQATYDTAVAGRGPGLAPLLPGGSPPNFDPSRLYELQRFLNGGR